MILGRAGDANAARLANALQPRGDIDAVAQNVLAVDQHVAETDADAVGDASGFGSAGVAFGHLLLHQNRAFDRRDDGRKFQQDPIAHRLDEPPAESANDRRRCLAMFPDRPRRPRLVLAHEARVADDVGGEDRGEAAGGGHCSGTPALGRPSLRNSPAPLRKRAIEKPGSSARPALASARASSNLPRFASVPARKKWVRGLVRLFSMERRNNATASSSRPSITFAPPAKCSQSEAKLSRGDKRNASFSWAAVSSG